MIFMCNTFGEECIFLGYEVEMLFCMLRIWSFISGGQLGLWVGISAVTLCEFMALAYQILHFVCSSLTTSISKNKAKAKETERNSQPDV